MLSEASPASVCEYIYTLEVSGGGLSGQMLWTKFFVMGLRIISCFFNSLWSLTKKKAEKSSGSKAIIEFLVRYFGANSYQFVTVSIVI